MAQRYGDQNLANSQRNRMGGGDPRAPPVQSQNSNPYLPNAPAQMTPQQQQQYQQAILLQQQRQVQMQQQGQLPQNLAQQQLMQQQRPVQTITPQPILQAIPSHMEPQSPSYNQQLSSPIGSAPTIQRNRSRSSSVPLSAEENDYLQNIIGKEFPHLLDPHKTWQFNWEKLGVLFEKMQEEIERDNPENYEDKMLLIQLRAIINGMSKSDHPDDYHLPKYEKVPTRN